MVSNSALVYNLGAGGTGGGRISGTTGLTKQGANVLILDEGNGSGSYNDFSGGLSISAGTVQVGNGDGNGAVGSGAVSDNGTLAFDRVDNTTNANIISGSGTLIQEGAGVLTLSGGNSFSGATLIENGTLRINNNSALGPTNDGAVTITNGGTMDIGGPSFGNQAFILGLKQIYVSGWGVNNNGAIINGGTNWQYANGDLLLVTMQGDAAIGGVGQATPGNGNTGGRWDLRGTSTVPAVLSTGGYPYNLFKVGSNQIVLVDATVDPNLANIDVRQGYLEVQGFTTLGNASSNLTVETGATFGMFQASASPNKNFVLNGNGRTYTVFSEGSANSIVGPITLNSGVCAFGCASGDNLSLSNSVSGAGSLLVTNANATTTLFLDGTNNTYNGNTLVLEGTLALTGNSSISNSPVITVGSGALLNVSARTGATLTLAPGQTLTGNGAVNGTVIAGSGATFEPGSPIGTMVFSNSLTLNSGSTTLIAINKSLSPSNSTAQVTGTVTYGGTLMITNLGAIAFAAGDSFKLFNASSYLGAFTSVSPAIPGINLAWNTNSLSSGVLSVVASPTPQPVIASSTMNGNNFILNGSNGVPGWPYWVLSTTNLALPMSDWSLISTGAFDPYGNFIFTNPMNSSASQNFYLLELQ
jgi:autotransporter-associated beta strand protein